MTLMTRLSRLLRADLHAVLDSIEEPQLLLKQAVREMEQELYCAEQKIRQLQHDNEQVSRRREQLVQNFNQLNSELEVCLQSGNDHLARSLMKRKLHTQRLREHLDRHLDDMAQQLIRMQEQLRENQLRFEGMRQKVVLLEEEQRQSVAEATEPFFTSGFIITDDEIEVALLQEKQRRQQQNSREPSR